MSTATLPDPDQVVVPDVPEPIRAWRGWQVCTHTDGTVHLRSFYDRTHWPTDRPLVARCSSTAYIPRIHWPNPPWLLLDTDPPPVEADTAPAVIRHHPCPCPPVQGGGLIPGWVHPAAAHNGHGCGLYGLANPDQVPHYLPGPVPGRVVVAGEVWLSGRYWEYTGGWRAERARPARLWATVPGELGLTYAHRDLVEALADRYQIDVIDPPDLTVDPRRSLQIHVGVNTAAFTAAMNQAANALAPLANAAAHVGTTMLTRLQELRNELLDQARKTRAKAARAMVWSGTLAIANATLAGAYLHDRRWGLAGIHLVGIAASTYAFGRARTVWRSVRQLLTTLDPGDR